MWDMQGKDLFSEKHVAYTERYMRDPAPFSFNMGLLFKEVSPVVYAGSSLVASASELKL